MVVNDDDVLSAFVQLSQEAAELWVPSRIAVIDAVDLDAIQFLRDYVALNVPVVVRGGCRHWPALTKWTRQYLCQALGDSAITVALTPDGRGDRIVGDRFVQPFERTMTLSALWAMLHARSLPVPYAQKQCDSLRDEYSMLLDDISEPDMAKVAFGAAPDAINLWIGDDRSVSSTHADPYENLYAVVRGRKHFTLLPPTDAPYLYRRRCRQGRYDQKADGSFEIQDVNEGEVPWVQVDPDHPNLEQFPLFAHATPLKVDVEEGDLLYLPSFWYHQVAQSPGEDGATIAVNFWYDVRFDARFCWLKLQEQLIEKLSMLDC